MRFTYLSGAMMVALVALFLTQRSAADGILPRHGSDCPAVKPQIINLPAQQIQVVTTPPQVIVNSASPRGRGAVGLHGVPMYQPMFIQQPVVGNIYVPQNTALHGASGHGAGAHALRAAHEMEMKMHEVNAHKAEHQRHLDAADQVLTRMRSQLQNSAPKAAPPQAGDNADLAAKIDNLSNRIGDIEKLLQIHDAALRDLLKKSGNGK